MSKVTKVFSQALVEDLLIAAHVQTTSGQRVIVYDYAELVRFLHLLNVPAGKDAAGLQRFLRNTYADVAARVFLNWLAEGQPSDVAAFWTDDATAIVIAESAQGLPPGIEPGSAAHGRYHRWLQEYQEGSYHPTYHEANWARP